MFEDAGVQTLRNTQVLSGQIVTRIYHQPKRAVDVAPAHRPLLHLLVFVARVLIPVLLRPSMWSLL
jgi:hypothetical protein